MEITFNTPAVLFPAISLLMLAYTNRFLALANLIRKLHEQYRAGKDEKNDVATDHGTSKAVVLCEVDAGARRL